MTQAIAGHLWQSTFFALAAGLVTVAFRGNRAQVRYWLWLSASLKFLVPFAFLLNLGSYLETWMPAARQIAPPAVSYTIEQFSGQFFSESLPSPTPAPDTIHWIPIAILAVWLTGFATVASIRLRGWRKIRTAVRASVATSIAGTVETRVSSSHLEPGVVGIVRPVLLLPEGIAERLTPSELETVVAHELCHVRRRDNLFAAIHMIVEATFWFHPLVWWIGGRLVEERERACDEEVLSQGSHPEVYANAIINVCKLYTQSPLACVSGVSGASIRRRIEAIMLYRGFTQLGRAKKFLLAGAGTAALTGPIVIGLLIGAANAPMIDAQSSPAGVPESATISFEAASVKPFAPVDRAGMTRPTAYPGGRFVAKWPLYQVIAYAYNLPFNRTARLSGIPDAIARSLFDIEATGTVPAGLSAQAREDRVKMMLRALLADRFKMAIHKETREIPVYALVPAKGGPKLQKADLREKDCPDESTAPQPTGSSTPDPETCHAFYGGQGRGLHGRAVNMADLASYVENWTDRPLLDKTGIRGLFHIETRPWQSIGVGPPPSPGAKAEGGSDLADLPTLFQVFEKLGLKMEARNDKADVYVVDHVEEPSEN